MPEPSTGVALGGALPLDSSRAESPARVRELAHEFEAMFLAQMLKQMRQSLVLAGDEESGDGFGKTAFTETFDTELARHLSASGGLGIADVIVEAYERQQGLSDAAGSSAVAGAESRFGFGETSAKRLREGGTGSTELVQSASAGSGSTGLAGSTGAVLPLPLGDRISSGFGWRRDPLTGAGRFHRGVDVKAAYGEPVPSVGDGAVVFAGAQGGYGLTVVVEHDSGIRTRYAHLSELAVRPGEAVRRGQDVGKVGSTGRSTGPHLHFEVLEHGRPVDPEQAAEKFTEIDGFKKMREVADSSGG